MEPLHIGFFTNTYLPVINGVVNSVRIFRAALNALGHNVFIFAQEDDYQDDEAFIFRYPSLRLPISVDIPAAIPVSPCVDRLLPSLKLNVIHTHHPILLGQTAASKSQELNLPLVFTFHTQYQEYTHYIPFQQEKVQEFLKNMVRNWLKEFMRKCQHIVIPSESMRDILIQEYGLTDRFTVIPTGLDSTPFKKANGKELRARNGWQADKVIVSVGRLAQEKNWSTLLQAVALAHPAHPDLRLVLVGDGPEKEALCQQAAELGIAERVTFAGALPFDEVPAYLKAADLFAFASVTETQGLVTMEAMTAGLPVVAVEGVGTRDIVEHGVQGLLTENDPQALGAALQQVLNNPSLMHKFKNAATRQSRAFDSQRLAKKLVKVYEQAIQDKKDNKFVTLAESLSNSV